jgi:hypothetical protein
LNNQIRIWSFYGPHQPNCTFFYWFQDHPNSYLQRHHLISSRIFNILNTISSPLVHKFEFQERWKSNGLAHVHTLSILVSYCVHYNNAETPPCYDHIMYHPVLITGKITGNSLTINCSTLLISSISFPKVLTANLSRAVNWLHLLVPFRYAKN